MADVVLAPHRHVSRGAKNMPQSFVRFGLLVLAAVIVVLLARPHIDYFLYAATEARTVTARGELSGWEQSNIRLFEQAAPAVVQIAGFAGTARPLAPDGGVQSGSGFVWDGAGHVVTNNHVIENARDVRVRLATDEVVEAYAPGRELTTAVLGDRALGVTEIITSGRTMRTRPMTRPMR